MSRYNRMKRRQLNSPRITFNPKRSLIGSLGMSIIAMAMLVFATYAWFSDVAVSKGSTVNTGVMTINLAVDQSFVDRYNSMPSHLTSKISVPGAEPDGEEGEAYTTVFDEVYDYKTLTDGAVEPADDADIVHTPYYIVDDKNVQIIHIENMAPGEAYVVTGMAVVNRGELAAAYTAGFDIEESLTGLENLNRKVSDGAFGNEPGVEPSAGSADTSADPGYAAYKVLKRTLVRNQIEGGGALYRNHSDVNSEEEGKEYYSLDDYMEQYKDTDDWTGRYLEEVLEVYAISSGAIVTDENIKDFITEENLVGTIGAIMNGQVSIAEDYLLPEFAVKTSSGGFEYINPVELTVFESKQETSPEGSSEDPEEPDPGVVYGKVSNVGYLQFILYLPEETGNEYEYARLDLAIGASAVQCEYEPNADGGYKIYKH